MDADERRKMLFQLRAMLIACVGCLLLGVGLAVYYAAYAGLVVIVPLLTVVLSQIWVFNLLILPTFERNVAKEQECPQ